MVRGEELQASFSRAQSPSSLGAAAGRSRCGTARGGHIKWNWMSWSSKGVLCPVSCPRGRKASSFRAHQHRPTGNHPDFPARWMGVLCLCPFSTRGLESESLSSFQQQARSLHCKLLVSGSARKLAAKLAVSVSFGRASALAVLETY